MTKCNISRYRLQQLFLLRWLFRLLALTKDASLLRIVVSEPRLTAVLSVYETKVLPGAKNQTQASCSEPQKVGLAEFISKNKAYA